MKESLQGKKSRDRNLAEKRVTGRIRCDIEVICTAATGDTVPGTITDLGPYGVRIRFPRAVKRDEFLLVEPIRAKGVLEGARYSVSGVKMMVVWCRKNRKVSGFSAGLRFADTRSRLKGSWVLYLLKRYGFQADYGTQRRKSIRASAELPVKYGEPRGYYAGTGRIVDLSMGGVSMLVNQNIVRGVKLDLEIGPFGNLQIFYVRGEVVWMGFSKREKTPVVGVSFYPLNEHQQMLLSRYISSIIKETTREE